MAERETLQVEKRNCRLRIVDCGLTDYRQVLQLQLDLRQKRYNGEIANTVLLTEHQPVITLGARARANKLLVEQGVLAQRGIDVLEIRRGGGTTAHNPGQVVFYPILKLREVGLGINEYIRHLEAIGAELLGQLGVHSEKRKGFPGLWVGQKKIASIGVRASKGVTFHGMAINIQNDLSIFDLIIPCGLDGVVMTSAAEEVKIGNFEYRMSNDEVTRKISRQFSMENVKHKLAKLCVKYFSSEDMVEYEDQN